MVCRDSIVYTDNTELIFWWRCTIGTESSIFKQTSYYSYNISKHEVWHVQLKWFYRHPASQIKSKRFVFYISNYNKLVTKCMTIFTIFRYFNAFYRSCLPNLEMPCEFKNSSPLFAVSFEMPGLFAVSMKTQRFLLLVLSLQTHTLK